MPRNGADGTPLEKLAALKSSASGQKVALVGQTVGTSLVIVTRLTTQIPNLKQRRIMIYRVHPAGQEYLTELNIFSECFLFTGRQSNFFTYQPWEEEKIAIISHACSLLLELGCKDTPCTDW